MSRSFCRPSLLTRVLGSTLRFVWSLLWDVTSGRPRAMLHDAGSLAFSTDGQRLATRDSSRRLHLWDAATASPITLTAQTPLAQFPAWVAHPISTDGPAVSLLDPFDEHALATLQALKIPGE